MVNSKKFGLVVAIAIVALSLLWLYPNYVKRYYSIEISSNTPITNGFINNVEIYFGTLGIQPLDIINDTDKATLVFADRLTQTKANSALDGFLSSSYRHQLVFYSYLPALVSLVGGNPINLGLDLQGGVQFILEVDLNGYIDRKIEALAAELRSELTKQDVSIEVTKANNSKLLLAFDSSDETKVDKFLSTYPQLRYIIRNGKANVEFDKNFIEKDKAEVVHQNVMVLSNRINELGVSESLVQIQGSNKILVELPGVLDIEAAKRVIGATANLEFRLQALPESTNHSSFTLKDQLMSVDLENDIILTGANINDAKSVLGQDNQPEVAISVDSIGAKKMMEITGKSIGRSMGIVLGTYISDNSGKQRYQSSIISLATIQSVLSSQFVITGLSTTEANDLAILLRSGTLSAPLFFVEEQVVGPSLGKENIDKGITSIILGFLLVVVFITAMYRVFGMIASFCLVVNIGLLMGFLGLLNATLTLSGMAGLLLTVGMAIDANVIVYSRMREHSSEKDFLKQIEYGYSGAWNSILDANLTTFLVALLMFAIGTGPVKGFAATLSLGVISSMISSIFVSRMFIYSLTPLLKKAKLRKYFL